VQRYNHTRKLFWNQEVVIANLKGRLGDSSSTFDATDVTTADLAGSEVSGNGWDAGGEPVTVTVTTVNTDDAMLDLANLSITATGGSIGPARVMDIYETDNSKLLYRIDFGEDKTAGVGTDFLVAIDANGLERIVNV